MGSPGMKPHLMLLALRLGGKDPSEGRFRVEINAPLVTHKSIQLPSGDEVNVEFEYEHLEKHCFACLSLTHEETSCPRSAGVC